MKLVDIVRTCFNQRLPVDVAIYQARQAGLRREVDDSSAGRRLLSGLHLPPAPDSTMMGPAADDIATGGDHDPAKAGNEGCW